jgi:hypothetical protein
MPKSSKKKDKNVDNADNTDEELEMVEKNDQDNIFDLTKMAPTVKNIEVKSTNIITPNEQDDLLKEYIELPREKWDKIDPRIHVRYLRKDGIFRKGGYLLAHYTKCIDDECQKSIHLAYTLDNYTSNKWYVYLNSIEKIWIKQKKKYVEHGNLGVIKDTFKTQDDNIRLLNDKIDSQDIKILQLQNEVKRTVNLIKKLHNINVNKDK